MANLDLFLHVFSNGVLERSKFHVYFDYFLLGQRQYFRAEKLLSRYLPVKEGIEVRVNDDLFLPVLH
jgi:hypothetical protein